MWKRAAMTGMVEAFMFGFYQNQSCSLKSEYRESLFCFLKKLTNFGMCTECTDFGYTQLGPKNHIFECNLHHFSKSNVYFSMANLKNSVHENSLEVLTFDWATKIAQMAAFRTWSIFVKKQFKIKANNLFFGKWEWAEMASMVVAFLGGIGQSRNCSLKSEYSY